MTSFSDVPSPAHDPAAFGFSVESLPLLASTQFCMEILLRGPVLDLASILEIVRFDPCAVLRLFAEAGRADHSPEAPASSSLSSCIVALGVAGLHRALAYAPSTWQQQGRLAAWAHHAATVAQIAAELAGRLGGDVGLAYVIGLLHDLDSLPATLDLPCFHADVPSSPGSSLFALLCDQCRLPQELVAALHSLGESTAAEQLWPGLIRAAHELAEARHLQMNTEFTRVQRAS